MEEQISDELGDTASSGGHHERGHHEHGHGRHEHDREHGGDEHGVIKVPVRLGRGSSAKPTAADIGEDFEYEYDFEDEDEDGKRDSAASSGKQREEPWQDMVHWLKQPQQIQERQTRHEDPFAQMLQQVARLCPLRAAVALRGWRCDLRGMRACGCGTCTHRARAQGGAAGAG